MPDEFEDYMDQCSFNNNRCENGANREIYDANGGSTQSYICEECFNDNSGYDECEKCGELIAHPLSALRGSLLHNKLCKMHYEELVAKRSPEEEADLESYIEYHTKDG